MVLQVAGEACLRASEPQLATAGDANEKHHNTQTNPSEGIAEKQSLLLVPTDFIAGIWLSGVLTSLFRVQASMEVFHRLGHPDYFATLLGSAQLLDVAALLGACTQNPPGVGLCRPNIRRLCRNNISGRHRRADFEARFPPSCLGAFACQPPSVAEPCEQ